MPLTAAPRRISSFSHVCKWAAYTHRMYATDADARRFLPPAKIRALISLYHQSDSFVTPENLSERIDKAFFGNDTALAQIADTDIEVNQLKNRVTMRRNAPRMSVWTNESVAKSAMEGWSSTVSSRELKVMEALYGVDTTHSSKKLPGLDVLEEEAGSVEQQLGEDRELLRDASVLYEEQSAEYEGQVSHSGNDKSS